MKFCVFVLFALLPWLPWIGDWALRWTEGNEALQVTFAMFVFPLAMNAVQYWIIDNFIMEKTKKGEYEAVQGDEDDDEAFEDSFITEVDEDVHGKDSEEGLISPPLKEVNPTPIPVHVEDDGRSGESSRRHSPRPE